MELGANGPTVQWQLAFLMKRLGEPVEQIAAVADDLAATKPNDPDALATAGRILSSLCEDDRAESCFREALASGKSEYSRILFSLLLLKKAGHGRLEEALDHISSSLTDLDDQREIIPEFLNASMLIVRSGYRASVEATLESGVKAA